MRFSVITLFPELVNEALKIGVIGQAIVRKKIDIEFFNPRTWTADIHKTIDDRPFGGGDGMVMLAEPLSQCIEHILKQDSQNSLPSRQVKLIFLSPQGKTLKNEKVLELSKSSHLVLLCGRYAGVDQRLINKFQMEELSIGDYVLSGGELGALVVIDSVCRHIEGVLGHESSSTEDSFCGEGLLEAPSFTRPREWNEQTVPEFLLSGNHAQIKEDRWLISIVITYVKRSDLFENFMKRQSHHKKVWQRAFVKLKERNNNELTSLGLTRKNLEDFEARLQTLKIL